MVAPLSWTGGKKTGRSDSRYTTAPRSHWTGTPEGKTRQPFGSCRRCGANWWLSCARVVAIRTRVKLQLDVIQLWRDVMVGINRWRGRSTAGPSLAEVVRARGQTIADSLCWKSHAATPIMLV